MAFTAPTTRATDYLVTAAVWNAEHVDNFNTGVSHLHVRKPSDESVAASTTPQNDDHLLMSVGANEVWLTRWVLVFTATTAAVGMRVQWSFPASGVLQGSWSFVGTSGAFANFGIISGTNPSTVQQMGAQNIGSDVNSLGIDLVYVNSSTAGTLQLLWAQTTSNATATVMKANSTLWAVKLA